MSNYEDERCDQCRFYEIADPGLREEGWCHRYAPRPVLSTSPRDSDAWEKDQYGGFACFPEMSPEEWCGEFQRGTPRRNWHSEDGAA